MARPANEAPSAFSWSTGGWFGTQVGSTLWLFVLSLVLSGRDAWSAGVCFGAFAAVNVWGTHLWRSRGRLRAYTALQSLLLAVSLVVAVVVVVVNQRAPSHPPPADARLSSDLPYWTIAAAPALMLVFFLRERAVRRQGS